MVRRAGKTVAFEALPAALFPALVVLGIALPLTFLAHLDQYLHYLSPLELLPTYATAWLLLALLGVPLLLVLLLALKLLQLGGMLRLRRGVALLLLGVGALAAIASLLLDGVIWLRTFDPQSPAGIDSTMGGGIVALSIMLAAPLLTHRGGRFLVALRSMAARATVLGGLTLLSLPFFRWGSSVAAPPLSTAAAAEAATLARPNIVLLTIDALSAPHMSLYGAKRPTTPSLDEFARGAAVFDRAYANANFTTEGIATILTGTLPWTHRAFELFTWPSASTRRESLPAIFARAGYQTGYVGTNSYAGGMKIGLRPYFSFRRGDALPMGMSCADRVAGILPYECAAAQLAPLVLAQQVRNYLESAYLLPPDNRFYDPRAAIDPALTWLARADQHRPVFLWVHLFPPHAPYAAPHPWLGRFDASPEARTARSSDPAEHFAFGAVPTQRVQLLEARYDEDVQYVDHYAGAFLQRALKVLGPNTVVVVTSDHGESFSHGYGGHGGPGLYDSIIHVPLIIKLPRQATALRIGTPVEQVDIAPTLAELAGIAPPALWEGASLLPLWRASPTGAASPPRPVFSMNFEENPRRDALTTGSIAVIDGPWKLVHYMGRLHYPQMPPLEDELFNLVSDPGESSNLASKDPEEARRLLRLISAQLARHGGPVR